MMARYRCVFCRAEMEGPPDRAPPWARCGRTTTRIVDWEAPRSRSPLDFAVVVGGLPVELIAPVGAALAAGAAAYVAL